MNTNYWLKLTPSLNFPSNILVEDFQWQEVSNLILDKSSSVDSILKRQYVSHILNETLRIASKTFLHEPFIPISYYDEALFLYGFRTLTSSQVSKTVIPAFVKTQIETNRISAEQLFSVIDASNLNLVLQPIVRFQIANLSPLCSLEEYLNRLPKTLLIPLMQEVAEMDDPSVAPYAHQVMQWFMEQHLSIEKDYLPEAWMRQVVKKLSAITS